MKKFIFSVLALFFVLAVGAYVFMYNQAARLIYWGHSVEYWSSKQALRCNSWHLSTAYADLREGKNKSQPLEVKCEEGIQWPAKEYTVKTDLGMNVHYRLYDTDETKKNQPLLFYIHGMTGNYADGIRYYHMASRLGFKLVLMELSNHGMSDNNGKGAAFGCREHHDVEAVFVDLLQRFPEREMLIYTTSMGSMAVANAAENMLKKDKKHQLIATVLESPIPSVKSVIMASKSKPPVPEFVLDMMISVAGYRAGYDFFECAPQQHLNKLKIPTLVQTTLKDHMVTEAMAKQVYQSLPGDLPNQYKVYSGGKHAAIWNGHPQEVEQDISNIWQVGLKFKNSRK